MPSLLLVLACVEYYVSYLVPTYIPLATSLVCLFSPELMAFQVKHVKVKKTKTKRRQVFVGRNSRQKNQNGAGTPPPSLTTLTT